MIKVFGYEYALVSIVTALPNASTESIVTPFPMYV